MCSPPSFPAQATDPFLSRLVTGADGEERAPGFVEILPGMGSAPLAACTMEIEDGDGASFPDEVAHVLDLLGKVYHNDALARNRKMSPEDRLNFHKAESAPHMTELETWMAEQIEERKVEPNSGLGEAIAYMQNHWDKLTLFLREPGAPLAPRRLRFRERCEAPWNK